MDEIMLTILPVSPKCHIADSVSVKVNVRLY